MSKMFLILQSLDFRKCLQLSTVCACDASLAKLSDNCETKQKIEFSVEHLSKNLNYLFQHEEEIVWMPRKPKYDILGCYRSCRISDKTKIRLGKVLNQAYLVVIPGTFLVICFAARERVARNNRISCYRAYGYPIQSNQTDLLDMQCIPLFSIREMVCVDLKPKSETLRTLLCNRTYRISDLFQYQPCCRGAQRTRQFGWRCWSRKSASRRIPLVKKLNPNHIRVKIILLSRGEG